LNPSVDSPIEQQSQASVRPVERHVVLDRHVAVLVPLALADQQVRRVGHRLHAAGHDDLDLAGADELVGQRDRVEAGQAHLVDRERGHAHRMPAPIAAWRAGICPAPAWSTWPHDHVLHLVGSHARALKGRLDRELAELGGRKS
jgi:hypothetical protein